MQRTNVYAVRKELVFKRFSNMPKLCALLNKVTVEWQPECLKSFVLARSGAAHRKTAKAAWSRL